MKCPKCGYLGFETVERCRNCGYDFALAPMPRVPDLPMRGESPADVTLPDLPLIGAGNAAATWDAKADATTMTAPRSDSELPLFGATDDDTPLITKASPPRQPLAVRRATPEIPRLRSEPRSASLDLPLTGDVAPAPVAPIIRTQAQSSPRPELERESPAGIASDVEAAHPLARLFAAAIDVVILGAIDALVIYLTLKICGLTRDELSILPKGPLVAFVAALNLGYFVLFTAGGQTIGKMASGIRIVVDDTQAAPDLGRAFRRTLVWAALALPAGLGFLSTLGADRRGLHDRLADTRVVRGGA